MLREELDRLFRWEERHRRLFSRLIIATGASVVVFLVSTPLVWVTERHHPGGAIHTLGDAAFFTATQLLTVSSSMPNPVSSAGRVIDVGLELWAVFVITAVGGSLATFFNSGDRSSRRS